VAFGRGTYFSIVAIYNTAINAFEDLDYILTSRLCDCIDFAFKYRQVRGEIWLEVGLSAFHRETCMGNSLGCPRLLRQDNCWKRSMRVTCSDHVVS